MVVGQFNLTESSSYMNLSMRNFMLKSRSNKSGRDRKPRGICKSLSYRLEVAVVAIYKGLKEKQEAKIQVWR